MQDVSFGYRGGDVLLAGMSLDLQPGSFHFLTGPSGSGKTTFLRLCIGELAPVSGRMLAFGRDLAGMGRDDRAGLRRRIGLVQQDAEFLDHLPMAENIALPLTVTGAPPDFDALRDLLGWVGLAPQARALPPALSGGERQRAALARAVILSPDLVLADEPTGNLDPTTAGYVFDALEALVRQSGLAALIATHNHELAVRMDRRVTLSDGKIVDF